MKENTYGLYRINWNDNASKYVVAVNKVVVYTNDLEEAKHTSDALLSYFISIGVLNEQHYKHTWNTTIKPTPEEGMVIYNKILNDRMVKQWRAKVRRKELTPTLEEWYKEFHRCYTPDFEQGKLYLKESKGRGKVGDEVCSICKTTGRYKLNVLGKSFLRYHILWMMKYGVFPTKEIDHIDRNKQNDSISNLRECTRKENSHNTTPKQGSSKYKGVSKYKNKWRAMIRINGKNKWLGIFDTEKEAAICYDNAVKQHRNETAFLNFP